MYAIEPENMINYPMVYPFNKCHAMAQGNRMLRNFDEFQEINHLSCIN